MQYGKIIRVIQGKHPKYNVKLDNGEFISIDHILINPAPKKLLKQGARLVVTIEKGKPVKASTVLSSSKKDLVQRTTPVVTKPVQKPTPHTAPAPVAKSEPAPTRREPAFQHVKVVDYDTRLLQLVVQTATGEKIRLHLPKYHEAWPKVWRGHVFQLETQYSGSNPIYNLILLPEDKKIEYAPARPGPQPEPEKSRPPLSADLVIKGAPAAQPAQVESPGPEAERISGTHIGVDHAYYEERVREKHRYEIMSFIKDHLNDDLIEWWKIYAEKTARYGEPAAPLSRPVNQALGSSNAGFTRFYSHQAKALEAIRCGKNLIIVTQTASGKTLCYNPAIFEHLVSDPSAHALYLFPLNALLYDQKEKIDQLANALAKQGIAVSSELLKGGVPSGTRLEWAANPPNVLAVNPELLSVILNEADKWQPFFENLRYVVIDEVHTYRGSLGMHTAGLIRRLLLATRRQHIEPQFILCSATVNNPMDLATRLTSLPADSFHLIDETSDGSAQAAKHWLVLNPDAHHENGGYDNYLYTAAFTLIELISRKDSNGRPSPLHTILFAKSIREVKRIYAIVQDNLKIYHSELAPRIRLFTASDLNPEEKRMIYSGLKSGEIVGVISSNALEAGIDIGKLDACIIAGFPFWVMRLKQMAGRVGRKGEGLVAFVPHPAQSVDQYYRNQPELLHDQHPEAFVVDAENQYIARKHINAAAFSMNGISGEELKIFGGRVHETIQKAMADGVMRHIGDRYWGSRRNYKDGSDPYVISGMRSTQQRPYVVCLAKDSEYCAASGDCFANDKKASCNLRITVLDQPNAYRDCHPGAIYEATDGDFYKITSFDDQNRTIRAVRLSQDTLDRTFVDASTAIEILGPPRFSKRLAGGATLNVGEVSVTHSYTGYYAYSLRPVRRCLRCKVILDEKTPTCPYCGRKAGKLFNQSKPEHQDFPEPYQGRGLSITLKTVACWMTVPAELEGSLGGASPCKLPGEDNRVQRMLSEFKGVDEATRKISVTPAEKQILEQYIRQASPFLRKNSQNNYRQDIVVFPGIYQQCLLSALRKSLPESRCLELFERLTGYPVTNNLKHVCRNCQTSVLLPAMHTIEHTVLIRYPSVALGDPTDLVSYTTLGHPFTGKPTIFWYDNYEGGIGAAEKVYDQIDLLLQNSERTLLNCNCTTLEGCPNCTQTGHCDRHNQSLSKPAALVLIGALQGRQFQIPFTPFIYPGAKKKDFDKSYQEQEFVEREHGMGEEMPSSNKEKVVDPYLILRVQQLIHASVLSKAFTVRSDEITNEIPAISAVELSRAFQEVSAKGFSKEWGFPPGSSPFQILEVQPEASWRMIQQIYHVIAMEIHPDHNPQKREWATEMMKQLNAAYSGIHNQKPNHADENSDD